MMFQEKIEPARISGARFVGIVALVILLLALALQASRALTALTGVGAFDALFLLFAVAIVFWLMRGTVVGYVYTLREDGALLLQRDYGSRINALLEVRAGRVLEVLPYAKGTDLRAAYGAVPRFCPARRATHVLVYAQEGKRRAVVFAPSQELLERIGEARRHAAS